MSIRFQTLLARSASELGSTRAVNLLVVGVVAVLTAAAAGAGAGAAV
jgi:hypothetical protein